MTAHKPGETSIQERTGANSLELAPRGLGDRTADEPTIVRWVANNVDVHEPDPKTCPAPFAWTLLRECRETPGFMATFLEKCWVKLIPARSQLDTGGPKVQDGKSVIELAERILAHSKAAHGEAVAEAAPVPPKRVSAFDAFIPIPKEV